MLSPSIPDKLRRLRTLLEHLERTENPVDDADTTEALKSLLLSHIRSLEAVADLESKPPEPPPE